MLIQIQFLNEVREALFFRFFEIIFTTEIQKISKPFQVVRMEFLMDTLSLFHVILPTSIA